MVSLLSLSLTLQSKVWKDRFRIRDNRLNNADLTARQVIQLVGVSVSLPVKQSQDCTKPGGLQSGLNTVGKLKYLYNAQNIGNTNLNISYGENDHEEDEEQERSCRLMWHGLNWVVSVTQAIETIQLMMFGFRALLSMWHLTIKRHGSCYF